VNNVTGSGGKWLDVSAERLPGWIASFAVRHGVSDPSAGSGEVLTVAVGDDHVSFTAQDGAVAQCYPPFPPAGGVTALLEEVTPPPRLDDPDVFDNPSGSGHEGGPDDPAAIAEALAAHARKPRTVGVLLVRLGGYAAGVFTGYPPVLGAAKVGSRPVHGRSAAGGWSQHRFARRREKQANEALSAAADAAVMIFGGGAGASRGGAGGQKGGAGGQKGAAAVRSTSQKRATTGAAAAAVRPQPRATRLDAVVLGGDRRAVADLRDDPRLAPYFGLATERFLTVPDPKRAVLLEAAKQFTAVRIWLTEP
jgi:Actinobacteria/chloroflexi VLRF1 release factor